MNDTWVVVVGDDEAGAVLQVLGAGTAATALVIGSEDVAQRVSRIVDDVRWIDAGDTPAEAWAQAAATLVAADGPAVVVGVGSPGGRAILGAIAVRLNAPLLCDVLALHTQDDGIEAERSALGGRVIETLHAPTPVCALTVVASDVQPPARDKAAAVTPTPATASGTVTRVHVEPSPASGARIADAERVVAVGRGLGSREALAEVEQLALALDAEIGCSMPVADELGWVPADRYIGWSGQHISPKLYVALGISGAPQHVAGMRNAQAIVAVNTDPHAPIFKTAHYGIVADLHQIVPELIRALGE